MFLTPFNNLYTSKLHHEWLFNLNITKITIYIHIIMHWIVHLFTHHLKFISTIYRNVNFCQQFIASSYLYVIFKNTVYFITVLKINILCINVLLRYKKAVRSKIRQILAVLSASIISEKKPKKRWCHYIKIDRMMMQKKSDW